MVKNPRGRPVGSTGPAVTLHPRDIQSALRIARRERYASRAELLVLLSTTLGLRASELAPMRLKDVYAGDGSVLQVIAVNRSFLPGKRLQIDLSDLQKIRRSLADHYEKTVGDIIDPEAPLFYSQRGVALSAPVIARYLTSLYRKAGIVGASSRSGRKTFNRTK